MEDKKERARRVVAYLEQRTVERGCTPAEAEQAATKAAEIRKRYGLGSDRVEYNVGDVLYIDLSDPRAASIILGFAVFCGQTFVREQVARRKSKGKRRPGTRARFAQFWRR